MKTRMILCDAIVIVVVLFFKKDIKKKNGLNFFEKKRGVYEAIFSSK